MQEQQRTYIAIDLKSFYASVECVDRGLDPLTTNLVVADESRTEKTICLTVSTSLKAYGIGGRARLFEVYQKARGVEFIIAPPRMAHYIEVSTKVYQTYLEYIAPEDIHVYSIDEVFMDVTAYLRTYKLTAHQLAMKMIRDVQATTGITATAGIGTNMYLAKVAMDIVAKKMPADKDGVRIAELDEMSYRRELWDYRPLTKFWRVGRGIAEKLAVYGIDTMGKIARVSIQNEKLLYSLFGVNAELLIDHAWGWEPCTMEAVKAYRPETNSFSSGQVLKEPYTFKKARVVIREMAEGMALDLVSKRLLTDQLMLTVSYDAECMTRPEIRDKYHGEITTNYYGKAVPKHAHGTFNFERPPDIVNRMGEIIASEYASCEPDFVLTMETKGIPVAFATANALGIPLVIARHSSKVYEGSAVNINYVSGSGSIETMSLSRRAVKENQRALIVDDFLKGGGTAKGMVELMREFNVTVAGMAFVMATVQPEKKRITGEKSLMTLSVTEGEPASAIVRPAEWLMDDLRNLQNRV